MPRRHALWGCDTSRVIGAVWLLALAGATLTPQPLPLAGRHEAAKRFMCLACGEWGGADDVLNIVLFLPLVLVLPLRRRRVLLTATLGMALSASIEMLQHFIPGRYSSLSDILCNSTGAALGGLLWMSRGVWLFPGPRVAKRLAAGAVIVAGGLTLAFGVLTGPSWTRDRYWGQWTPDLGFMEQYRGSVLGAWLDSLNLPSGPFPTSENPRGVLSGEWTLRAMVTKGPPPRSLAPIVSIFDGHQREILVLAAVHEDLVFQERTWASVMRLDQPDIQVRGALAAVQTGDTMHLTVRREGRSRCLAVNGKSTCHAGYTFDRSWSLLLYPMVPMGARRAADVMWLVLMLIPVGYWSADWRDLIRHGLIAVAAIGLAAALTGLTLGSWPEAMGVPAGLLAGYRMGVYRRRRARGRGTFQPPTNHTQGMRSAL